MGSRFDYNVLISQPERTNSETTAQEDGRRLDAASSQQQWLTATAKQNEPPRTLGRFCAIG